MEVGSSECVCDVSDLGSGADEDYGLCCAYLC